MLYFIRFLIGGYPRHPRETNIPGSTPVVMPVWVSAGAFLLWHVICLPCSRR